MPQIHPDISTNTADDNPSTSTRFPAGCDPVKRDQILDGAHRVFALKGFDAAGMADITRAAGVSKGTIYVYFQGKDDLFEALMDRERDRMFQDIAAALDVSGTTEERLYSYGLALTRLVCSDTVIRAHRIIIAIASRRPDIGATFYAKGAGRGVAFLGAFINQEVSAGRMHPCDPERTAQQFVEMCLAGLFRQRLLAFLPNPPTDIQIEDNVRSALNIFQRAFIL